jgi:type I restriction enzyme, R subunit
MIAIAESHVEEAALSWLIELGYRAISGFELGPDGSEPERANYGEVLLIDRLRAAIERLNPGLTSETRAAVLAKITQTETPSLVGENRRLHRYLVEGVPVEVRRNDGTISGEQARLIDFDDMDANDWLAVNQLIVIENKANRRPDVVIFVNGLPLGVIELKNPGDENATIDGAFNQLQTYKAQIGSLFRANAVLVTSDGIAARIGSVTSDYERFMPWRTITGDSLAPKSVPELETVLKGVFDRRHFLDLIKDFIVFGDMGGGTVKILAGYHQFHAVRRATTATLTAR